MYVYADNAATTAMSETALEAMLPCLREECQPLQPPHPRSAGGGEAGPGPGGLCPEPGGVALGDHLHLRRQ